MNELWNNDGKLHCVGCPAIKMARPGQPYREYWENGRYIRCEGPQICLLNPVLDIPNYPANLPLATAMRLGDLLNLELSVFSQIADWIEKESFHGMNFLSSHGDFGALAYEMINVFALHANVRKLSEKITVKIEDEDLTPIEQLFPNENNHQLDPYQRPQTDALGIYNSDRKQIVLYIRKIVKCASKLDLGIHASPKIIPKNGVPSAMTLFNIVFLHELGHALHHTMTGFSSDWGATEEKEQLAQLFTRTCIEEYGNHRAKNVFEELEKLQHPIYSAWRRLIPIPINWANCKTQFENHPKIEEYSKVLKTIEKLSKDDQEKAEDLLNI